jgi:hypothetical protein
MGFVPERGRRGVVGRGWREENAVEDYMTTRSENSTMLDLTSLPWLTINAHASGPRVS